MKAKCMLAAAFLVCAIAGNVQATEPSATITVDKLHCAGCAKRVAGELQKVAGVETAEADLKTQSFAIKVKPKMTVSVKALWEAAEKGKEKVVKIATPGGEFTTKPQS